MGISSPSCRFHYGLNRDKSDYPFEKDFFTADTPGQADFSIIKEKAAVFTVAFPIKQIPDFTILLHRLNLFIYFILIFPPFSSS